MLEEHKTIFIYSKKPSYRNNNYFMFAVKTFCVLCLTFILCLIPTSTSTYTEASIHKDKSPFEQLMNRQIFPDPQGTMVLRIHSEQTVYASASHQTEALARSIARDFTIDENMFVCILQKESGLNSRRKDGTLKCGDGGRSCGLGQIQLPTWISIRRHAGWSTEDLRHDDYENLRTTAYGLKTYWPLHWTGYHICSQMGHTL